MKFITRKLIIVLALSLFTGCYNFYDKDEDTNLTEVTFDKRFPDGLEEAFNKCTAPFEIGAGDREVDPKPLDDCHAGNLSSEGFLVAGAIDSRKFDLTDRNGNSRLEENIKSGTYKYELGWPAQHCGFEVEYDVDFNKVQIDRLDAFWSLYTNGNVQKPSLRKKLVLGAQKIGKINFETNIVDTNGGTCSNFNRNRIKGSTREMRDELNGSHNIHIQNTTLTVNTAFTHTDTSIDASPKVDFQIGDLWIDINWDRAGKAKPLRLFEKKVLDQSDIDDMNKKAKTKAQNKVETALQTPLNQQSTQIGRAVERAVPSGEVICDMEKDGFSPSMTITTDDPSDQYDRCEEADSDRNFNWDFPW